MKRFFFIFLLMFCSHLVMAQYTNIPDPNFEQALIDKGLDSGPLDGKVLTSEIEDVTDLLVQNKEIESLVGIEDFTALEVLNCKNNEITTLNLFHSPNLRFLECKFNDLISLYVAQNSALEHLDCSANNLTSLLLSNTTALKDLDCSATQITELDLSNNLALEKLDVNFANMEELDLSNNLELFNLNISNTPLTEIDLSHNSALRFIKATYLDLEELDVTQNSELLKLWIRGTNISELDVTQNPELGILRIGDNEIDSIDVSQNPELIELEISQSNFTFIDVSNNPLLETINCNQSLITELNLSPNPNLERIYCWGNSLTCLNVRNGNNQNVVDFYAVENPFLTCIQVDDPVYSNQNWIGGVDSIYQFNIFCNDPCSEEIVNIESVNDISSFQYFPNPTSGHLQIIGDKNYQDLLIKAYNVSGQELSRKTYNDVQNIDFELEASAGIYFITIETEGNLLQRFKIIKN